MKFTPIDISNQLSILEVIVKLYKSGCDKEMLNNHVHEILTSLNKPNILIK